MRDLFKAMKAMDPNIEMVDEDEEERTEALMLRRARGKGAPPKKKSKAGTWIFFISLCGFLGAVP